MGGDTPRGSFSQKTPPFHGVQPYPRPFPLWERGVWICPVTPGNAHSQGRPCASRRRAAVRCTLDGQRGHAVKAATGSSTRACQTQHLGTKLSQSPETLSGFLLRLAQLRGLLLLPLVQQGQNGVIISGRLVLALFSSALLMITLNNPPFLVVCSKYRRSHRRSVCPPFVQLPHLLSLKGTERTLPLNGNGDIFLMPSGRMKEISTASCCQLLASTIFRSSGTARSGG